jgi:uncharacterized protein with HEPN domain
MSKRDYKIFLEDIIESIDKIKSYTKNLTFYDFAQDSKTIDAVVRNIEIIGEAAHQIPSDIMNKFKYIEWHKLKAIRNRIVHEYFGVDYSIIWEIIQNDIDLLRSNIKDVLEHLQRE